MVCIRAGVCPEKGLQSRCNHRGEIFGNVTSEVCLKSGAEAFRAGVRDLPVLGGTALSACPAASTLFDRNTVINSRGDFTAAAHYGTQENLPGYRDFALFPWAFLLKGR